MANSHGLVQHFICGGFQFVLYGTQIMCKWIILNFFYIILDKITERDYTHVTFEFLSWIYLKKGGFAQSQVRTKKIYPNRWPRNICFHT